MANSTFIVLVEFSNAALALALVPFTILSVVGSISTLNTVYHFQSCHVFFELTYVGFIVLHFVCIFSGGHCM